MAGGRDHWHFNRRRMLQYAAAAVAARALTPWPARAELPRAFAGDPFKLGVASGDPMPTGFVIWTRLAPHPFSGEPVSDKAVPVGWEVAEDPNMKRIVRTGEGMARPDLGHSVHVELQNLPSGRDYWYRFHAGEAVSPVGRSWTAPPPHSALPRLKMAVASCQHYAQGYFSAYRDMIANDVDLILHLGDYIYEYDTGALVRRHPYRAAQTLEHYRAFHAAYKLDKDLQAAHAHCPWLAIWDDHEVQNDYSPNQSWLGPSGPEFVQQIQAAYQAYYEHMPLRLNTRAIDSERRIYHRPVFGDLMQIALLDERQYRTEHACETEDMATLGGHVVNCEEVHDPARSRLGADQERWFNFQFGNARTRWNALGTVTLFSQLNQFNQDGEVAWWSEGWDGWRPNRQRIIDMMTRKRLENIVVLGGDMHAYWVSDVKADYDDPDSATIGAEFVGTSISTDANAFTYRRLKAVQPENPHIKFIEEKHRGYMLCDIDHSAWRTTFRTVDDPLRRDSGFSTLADWRVEAGRPGAERLS